MGCSAASLTTESLSDPPTTLDRGHNIHRGDGLHRWMASAKLLIHHPIPSSGEEGDTLLQLGPTDAESGNSHCLDHHQHQSHIDAHILQSLPR
jgi:hypothetical protein